MLKGEMKLRNMKDMMYSVVKVANPVRTHSRVRMKSSVTARTRKMRRTRMMAIKRTRVRMK